ncbi:Kef-type potassium/proton antiporter accessory protein (CPA2 family) [Paucimonas lemoignei]|uniref:Kef-type potassium/proton antiporter accessory protein (CPA2 family) n=1 Tax=Paucimonas lemoignei TaxID=29443 RepID=A0A4R3HPU3_PAULE|nr:NAD(P)H-dependent oxidoreductase [Paucimonas lemoignei]TCS33774.1 Kef-type potassium/proton antiporter accessory protein (CPA2 family) [Paucimonas lemoignei]
MNPRPAILVVYAHPAPHRSRINRALIHAARALPHVEVHDLYDMYPDFDIDVPREQALLQAADLIIFQHPVMWSSMPSLLKEWVDVVLESGWAHGRGSAALHGKDFWLVATAGGSQEADQEGGYHGYELSALLPPFEQIAALCGMRWLPPYILQDAHRLSDADAARHIDGYSARLMDYPAWCGKPLIISPTDEQDWSGKA